MNAVLPPMNATTQATTSSAPGDALIWPRGQHILLVDDDPVVRDSLAGVLMSAGYSVLLAEHGQQALDLAGVRPVDLVLLDLNMPVKNGWDTFERLSSEHPLMPVIVTTARPNQLFTAVGAGVGALLEKPMDMCVLLRTIEKLLAETPVHRLARLAGKREGFILPPPWSSRECNDPTRWSIIYHPCDKVVLQSQIG